MQIRDYEIEDIESDSEYQIITSALKKVENRQLSIMFQTGFWTVNDKLGELAHDRTLIGVLKKI